MTRWNGTFHYVFVHWNAQIYHFMWTHTSPSTGKRYVPRFVVWESRFPFTLNNCLVQTTCSLSLSAMMQQSKSWAKTSNRVGLPHIQLPVKQSTVFTLLVRRTQQPNVQGKSKWPIFIITHLIHFRSIESGLNLSKVYPREKRYCKAKREGKDTFRMPKDNQSPLTHRPNSFNLVHVCVSVCVVFYSQVFLDELGISNGEYCVYDESHTRIFSSQCVCMFYITHISLAQSSSKYVTNQLGVCVCSVFCIWS